MSENTNRPLPVLRAMVDQLDREILELLARRQAVAAEIAATKRTEGKSIRDLGREQAVLDARKAQAEQLHLPPNVVESISAGRTGLTAHRDRHVGIAIGLERAFQHVPTRAGNRLGRRLGGETSLPAQLRLIDNQSIERDIEIRAARIRREISTHVVARHHVIVTEARERARAAHLDDDDRGSRIDAEHGSALGGRAQIRLLGKVFRLQVRGRRTLRGLRGACAQHQRGEPENQRMAAGVRRRAPRPERARCSRAAH